MSSVGEVSLDAGKETRLSEERKNVGEQRGEVSERALGVSRYEERSVDGREFRTFKYVFYGEGRVEAVMRTCERHEMSKKVSVCETGMPYAESGESNFEVTRGLIR